MLDLEFAYARIDGAVDGSQIELARWIRGWLPPLNSRTSVERSILGWPADPATSPLLIPDPVGKERLRLRLSV